MEDPSIIPQDVQGVSYFSAKLYGIKTVTIATTAWLSFDY